MPTLTKTRTFSRRTRISRPVFLRREVMRLRSLMIGMIGTDEEGQYRPEFVEQTLEAANDKPTYTFTDPKTFLEHLQSV